jgi:hypothetical protein
MPAGMYCNAMAAVCTPVRDMVFVCQVVFKVDVAAKR